jgi:hypothetical protein
MGNSEILEMGGDFFKGWWIVGLRKVDLAQQGNNEINIYADQRQRLSVMPFVCVY